MSIINFDKQPKVSVLMSVYNEPLEWIQQAINSITTQTYADFEFIIINDKPERSELNDFLKLQANLDSRILIHTNEENIGLTKSLNVGLNLCRGIYIARMDADDISLPMRLEKQIAFMDNNPQIIASSALAINFDGIKLRGNLYRPVTHEEFEEYIFTSSPFIHPLLIVRKSILIQHGLKYDESFRVCQDYKIAADLIKIGQLANINETLLYYRVSESQISNARGKEQQEAGKRIRRELINNFYSKLNIKILPEIITFQSILDNYYAIKKINPTDKHSKSIMNHIRRVLYYSLTDYSLKSLIKFILSFDYLQKPYNLRRFIIIICKSIKINLVPPLV